jgi:ribonuclease HI
MAAFYVLNTDALIGPSRKAAIGVVLRQKLRQGRPLTVVAFLSKRIDTDDIATAEYRALIEGLRLAAPYEPTTLRVFTDSNFIPDQINDPDPEVQVTGYETAVQPGVAPDQSHRKERVKVLWVPRDMNTEADQRAADAFFVRKGDAWVRPTST